MDLAIAGMMVGARIQRLFSAATFNRMLNRVLLVIAIALTVQGSAWFLR